MVLHNPNNWHWVNKDATEWTKQWLSKELEGISAEQGSVKANIGSVSMQNGDVEVSQRKGKVITIYEFELSLDFEGTAENGESASGTIKLPEVSHDMQEYEYVVCFPSTFSLAPEGHWR